MKKIVIVIAALMLMGCQDNVINDNVASLDFVEVSLPENGTTSPEPVEADTTEETTEEAVSVAPVVEVEEVVVDPMTKNREALSKDDVLWLQESLKIAGYYTSRDGSYGKDTQAKLEAFQKDQGLLVGLYDEMTIEAFVAIRGETLAPRLGSDLVLINKHYYLPSDFVPENLRKVEVRSNKDIDLPDHVASIVEQMFQDAEEDGMIIYLASGYRSYDYQEGIFSRRVNANGFEEAETVVAIPGESEHQTGLAIDVTDATMDFGLDQTYELTDTFQWMMDHCASYGFILRYPKDKTQITQYIYEPWHYRYIGDVEMAKTIMSEGITLEEYYER